MNQSFIMLKSNQKYRDQIFDKARLVNCALIAKIHT